MEDRIKGYDLARTVSLFGMVMISYWELSGENEDPEWLYRFIQLIMGRAAVTFVMLAGVGLYLLTKEAYRTDDRDVLVKHRKSLIRRAGFLFLLGIMNSLVWPWDILHFYAVYFIIASFFITSSNRRFWIVISVAVLLFSGMMQMVHFERNSEWETFNPVALWHLSGMFYHLLFGGLYPIFPWIGFVFLGMWIGRRDLTNRRFRNTLLGTSIAAVAACEAISWMYFNFHTSFWRFERFTDMTSWFEIDPWTPMPLFVVSGAGTAIIVTCLCFKLVDWFKSARWLSLLVSVGQTTLTLYVAHTAIGRIAVMIMDYFDMEYLLFAIWGSLSYFAASILFCYFWNRRYKRGPLELLMRHFLNTPIRLTLSGTNPIDLGNLS